MKEIFILGLKTIGLLLAAIIITNLIFCIAKALWGVRDCKKNGTRISPLEGCPDFSSDLVEKVLKLGERYFVSHGYGYAKDVKAYHLDSDIYGINRVVAKKRKDILTNSTSNPYIIELRDRVDCLIVLQHCAVMINSVDFLGKLELESVNGEEYIKGYDKQGKIRQILASVFAPHHVLKEFCSPYNANICLSRYIDSKDSPRIYNIIIAGKHLDIVSKDKTHFFEDVEFENDRDTKEIRKANECRIVRDETEALKLIEKLESGNAMRKKGKSVIDSGTAERFFYNTSIVPADTTSATTFF